MTVGVHLFSVGYCRNRAWFVERGSLARQIHLPAMVAVIRHPRLGLILFDTGYGQPLRESTSWAARAYRAILPFECPDEQTVPYHLWSLGLSVKDLSLIILSHFHPDHIGSLKELPRAPILHSQAGLTALAKYTPAQRARAAFFPELLPDDFPERAQAIEGLPRVELEAGLAPFTEAYDVAGDGSLLAIALPGHAEGQYGLLCRIDSGDTIFLVADAAWTKRNIREFALPGWPAGAIIGDRPAFEETLGKLRKLQRLRPDVALIPSHCQESIAAYENGQ